MADRRLVCRLGLALLVHQQFDGKPLFRQPLLEPLTREVQHRTLARESLAKLRHERTGPGQIGLGHVRHHGHEVRWAFFRHGLQPVHPTVRQIAIDPRERQPRGDALQVLDQAEPEHDRDRPKFAQRERNHLLIGTDKGAERSRLNLRIRMRDQLKHDVIDAGQPGGRTVLESRQFPAVAAGQMAAGQLYLFLDKVEIVEQPLGGGSDAAAGIDGERGLIEGVQPLFVLSQSRQQRIGAVPRDDPVARGERPGMARELLDAEQLGAQRRLLHARTRMDALTHPSEQLL